MSGRRSLYFRILRIRHLRLHPLVTSLLFEGSVVFAILLALAEIVHAWAILAIPVAVALFVKLNDVVERALIRPYALAQLRAPRPADPHAVGRSRVRVRGVAAAPPSARVPVGDGTAEAVAAPDAADVTDAEPAGPHDAPGRGNRGRFPT